MDVSDLIVPHKKWWYLPDQQQTKVYPTKMKEFVDFLNLISGESAAEKTQL